VKPKYALFCAVVAGFSMALGYSASGPIATVAHPVVKAVAAIAPLNCGAVDWQRKTLDQLPWSTNVPNDQECNGTSAENAMFHCTPGELDDFAERDGALRDWAKTLPRSCAQNAYLGWADFFDGEVYDDRRALKAGPQPQPSFAEDDATVQASVPMPPAQVTAP